MSGSFPLPHWGWIYSQLRDQTCSVYGWHACYAAGKVMSRTGYLSPDEGCGTHRKKKVTLLYIVISIVFMLSVLFLLQLHYTAV